MPSRNQLSRLPRPSTVATVGTALGTAAVNFDRISRGIQRLGESFNQFRSFRAANARTREDLRDLRKRLSNMKRRRTGNFTNSTSPARFRFTGSSNQRPRISSFKEVKFKDKTNKGSPTTIIAAGVIIADSISGIAQGTGNSQRVGFKAQAVGLDINYWLHHDHGTTTTGIADNVVRLYLVLDRNPCGTIPTVGEILEDADTLSFLNLDNTRRFRVLKSKVINLNRTNALSWNGTDMTYMGRKVQKKLHVSFLKGKGLTVVYGGTGQGYADITANNILLLGIQEGGNVDIEWRSRIRYVG